MKTSIYSHHRFHPDIIRRAIWMYFRFNLSFRDVEELMIERGIDVSYETIRRWVDKFGSTYASRIKSRSEAPSPVWHLDEVYTKIDGKMVYFMESCRRRRHSPRCCCSTQKKHKNGHAFTSQTPKKPRGKTD